MAMQVNVNFTDSPLTMIPLKDDMNERTKELLERRGEACIIQYRANLTQCISVIMSTCNISMSEKTISQVIDELVKVIDELFKVIDELVRLLMK